MDAVTQERTLSLAVRAQELTACGHYARALAKLEEALAPAEPCAPPHCLVTATLRFRLCKTLAKSPDVESMTSRLAREYNMLGVVVHQRIAENTLLPGRCRQAEEVWFRQHVLRDLSGGKGRRNVDLPSRSVKAAARLHSPCIGYELLLGVAYMALSYLFGAVLERAAPADDTMRALCSMLEGAVEALVSRERANTALLPLREELDLVRLLESILPPEEPTLSQHELGRRLLKARQVLQRSKVWPIDEADAEGVRLEQTEEGFLVSARAKDAAVGLKHCALAACGAKEAHASHFSKCGACKTVAYCCREHQVADWPAHKAACKAARRKPDAE